MDNLAIKIALGIVLGFVVLGIISGVIWWGIFKYEIAKMDNMEVKRCFYDSKKRIEWAWEGHLKADTVPVLHRIEFEDCLKGKGLENYKDSFDKLK